MCDRLLLTHVSVDGSIRYVAVGNEPFLNAYGDKFVQTTYPALQNIQAALTRAGLAQQIKATVPLNADVYQTGSGLPSGGDFRPDILTLITSIIKLLQQNGSPVIVNIYPFLSLQSDPNFPKEYAFFDNSAAPLVDGSITYTNVYDANFDTLISALEKNGFAAMPVIIGEVGWPTDGDPNANVENARRFNQGLVARIISAQGTPKRRTPPDVYLFSLIDEDNKTTEPGKFERHWGIFNFDGSLKYRLDLANGKSLVPAKGVKYLPRRWCVMASQANEANPDLGNAMTYACDFADCTSLGLGSSCGNLDVRRNASYAFNMYYQTEDQRPDACNFNGLAAVTTTDPSLTGCRFEIMIDSQQQQSVRSSAVHGTGNSAIGLLLGFVLGLGSGSVFCGI